VDEVTKFMFPTLHSKAIASVYLECCNYAKFDDLFYSKVPTSSNSWDRCTVECTLVVCFQ